MKNWILTKHNRSNSLQNTEKNRIKISYTPEEEYAEIEKLGNLKGSKYYAVESS